MNRHRFYEQHFTIINSYQCKLQLRDHTYSMIRFSQSQLSRCVRSCASGRACGVCVCMCVCVCVVLFILFHCGFFTVTSQVCQSWQSDINNDGRH